MSVDIKQMVTEIIRNSKTSALDADVLCKEIMTMLKQDLKQDPSLIKHICSGDDLVEILIFVLTKVIGNFRSKKLDQNSLRSILRIAYDRDCFSSSNVYNAIKKWEISNQGFTIL